MTKRTVSSRFIFRGCVGAAVLLAAVLGAGPARADYNIKATEAANTSLVTDGRCNLAEAIESLNNGRTAPGSGVSNNTSGAGGEGGAGIYGIGSSISLVQSTVTGNKSPTNGGGVYSYDTAVYVYRSTISANTAGFDGGGFTTSSALRN